MALHLKWFTFNPFSENTYVLYGDNKECIIFDPGCFDEQEEHTLTAFIEEKDLKPVRLILTHAHIDHVLGVRFIAKKYNLKPEMHRDDIPVYDAAGSMAKMFGIQFNQGPQPELFLDEHSNLALDGFSLAILHLPGHSPGSIGFYCNVNNFIVSGDVLMNGSIGRTDLPGGNFETLSESIRTKLYTLPDNTRVFSGHGPSTLIGNEKINNPFVKA